MITINTKTIYITSDGMEFETLERAEQYEKNLQDEVEKTYQRYIKLSGLSQEDLDSYGYFLVAFDQPDEPSDLEDYEVFFQYYSGKYSDVLRKAISSPHWNKKNGYVEKLEFERIGS